MHQLRRLLCRVAVVAALLGFAVATQAEEQIVSSDFFVTTADGTGIHVHRKAGAHPTKVPVLLVHGTWGDGRIWDFPGRSVMDYLASRGYDVYALDMRGMGLSDHPANYGTIHLASRVQDVAAVAGYIAATRERAPVVIGWSQGAVITGLFAASAPPLVSGVGLLSAPGDGFFVPPSMLPLLASVVASGVDRYLPAPEIIYAIAFGFDPVTGNPTISPDVFASFVLQCEPDSMQALLELLSPDYFNAAVAPAWHAISAPALVVDGGQDAFVGESRAQALFNALGSQRKQLIILPRNAHTWFLEDNYNSTMRTFDRFLSQFP